MRDDFFATPALDYEAWRDAFLPICGRYTAEGFQPDTFSGRARGRNICGFKAVDVSFNARSLERSPRDVRADSVDHYYVLFQMAGRSRLVQNDQDTELCVGDTAIVDASLPMTYLSGAGGCHWRSLQLPRRSVVAHLGLEPRSLCTRRGATAARLLQQLLDDGLDKSQSLSDPANAYMSLACYDLVGALFAPPERDSGSRHTDKLFRSICAIVRERFADPDLAPRHIAEDLGISVRYLQKLFTQRNATFSQCVNAVRLDHAAALLKRRHKLNSGRSISDIAYVCGFNDYSNFHRRFRDRFGHTPGSVRDLIL